MEDLARKKIARFLILTLLITGSLPALMPASGLAQTEVRDSFESWRNPSVANGWTSFSYGGGGGEYNQVYETGQGISCGGDGSNFKSVYRDVPVVPGHTYQFLVSAISNSSNAAGARDPSYVRFWVQFDDAAGNVLDTFGTDGNSSYRQPTSNVPPTYGLDETDWSTMFLNDLTAPTGSSQARVVLQVMGGTGGGTVFRDVRIINKTVGGLETLGGLVAPEMLVRNTEWAPNSPVAIGWGSYSYGGGPGDYELRIAGGSSQGISCSGEGLNYKQIYRDVDVNPGATYEAYVSAISNSANTAGVRDPSYVSMYVQFMDAAGNVPATYTRSGAEEIEKGVSGVPGGTVNDTVWKTISIRPMTAPKGTSRARVILRVNGGTGGGTVFDDFRFRRTGD